MGPLVEGRDYYVENGLYVFTADYLRRRGYCCCSGCRHCPYGFRHALNESGSAGEETHLQPGEREREEKRQ